MGHMPQKARQPTVDPPDVGIVVKHPAPDPVHIPGRLLSGM